MTCILEAAVFGQNVDMLHCGYGDQLVGERVYAAKEHIATVAYV